MKRKNQNDELTYKKQKIIRKIKKLQLKIKRKEKKLKKIDEKIRTAINNDVFIIPDDIWYYIFEYIEDDVSFNNLMLACKKMNFIIHNQISHINIKLPSFYKSRFDVTQYTNLTSLRINMRKVKKYCSTLCLPLNIEILIISNSNFRLLNMILKNFACKMLVIEHRESRSMFTKINKIIRMIKPEIIMFDISYFSIDDSRNYNHQTNNSVKYVILKYRSDVTFRIMLLKLNCFKGLKKLFILSQSQIKDIHKLPYEHVFISNFDNIYDSDGLIKKNLCIKDIKFLNY